MSNHDRIRILYDKAEKLTGIRYSVFNAGLDGIDWIEAVEMRFENTVVTFCAEPDSDEIQVELEEMKVSSGCCIKVAASEKHWVDAVGRTLSWIWLLRNQQGYEDGIRFEFSYLKDEEKPPVIITLIVIASSIKMYFSQEIIL